MSEPLVNYGTPSGPCEVCGVPTPHNVICIVLMSRMVAGTTAVQPHQKHWCCRPCEEAMIERNRKGGKAIFQSLWLRFPACPEDLTEDDKTMIVLSR